MNRPAVPYQKPCLTAVWIIWLLSVVLAAPAGAETGSYGFERMFPLLEQPWYFSYPSALCIGNSGEVYVLDSGNHRVIKLTGSGVLITQWGKGGTDDGQFYYPRGMAADSSGNLYITDTGNSRIQKFNADGTHQTTWDLGYDTIPSPFGIAVDAGDAIYFVGRETHRVYHYTSDGTAITGWGGKGTSPGLFQYPEGVAVDSRGRVFVTDTENHRVQVFSSSGIFLFQFGSYGSADGQFSAPGGILIDENDQVMVVDVYNTRVQVFDSSGTFIRKWGEYGRSADQFSSPYGICRDPNGVVLVSDVNTNSIKKFQPDGTFLSAWESRGQSSDGRFDYPVGIDMDRSGMIYVADRNNCTIHTRSATGAVQSFIGEYGEDDDQFLNLNNAAVNSQGQVVALCTEPSGEAIQAKIKIFSSSGGFIRAWNTHTIDDIQLPMGLSVDGTGNVFVSDTLSDQIHKFDPTGSPVSSFGSTGTGQGQFNTPGGIAHDSSGNVYAADIYNHRIQKFTSDGMFIGVIGEYGTGNGELNLPADVCIDSQGNLLVADTGNHRIAVFDSAGVFMVNIGGQGSDPGSFSSPVAVACGTDDRIVVVDRDNNRVQMLAGDGGTDQGKKAVIVAGGGDYSGNTLWAATQMCANYAYRALLFQGYSKESIYYLTSDTDLDLDGNGILDDVDADATNAGLQQAVTTWASGADDLLLYITDHGGSGTFRMGETEILTAGELDTWLDTFQSASNARVTIIYDACQSGSFLPELATTAYSRVFIASALDSQQAYFTAQGQLSFSGYFWGNIINGMPLYDAFVNARNAVTYSYIAQTPLVGADGNTTGNEDTDMDAIQGLSVGNGIISADDLPVIGSVSVQADASDSGTAVITASSVVDTSGISRVWAIISPPEGEPVDPSTPVLTLPEAQLKRTAAGTYQGSHDGFTRKGTYRIAVFAMDSNGTVSLPSQISFEQTDGESDNLFDGDVDITGLSVIPAPSVNTPVTIAMSAQNNRSGPLYYRFSTHPDYGTSGYDGRHWSLMTAAEYVAGSSIDYTFTEPGRHIVVVWATDDSNGTKTAGIPIIGLSVDTASDTCKTSITGCTIAGTRTAGATVFFNVAAGNPCADTLYYRFSMHPDYGTDGYDGRHWSLMTDSEWVTTDTISYTFAQSGSYVVVAWVSDTDQEVDSIGIPIIGWSVDIE